MVGDLPMHVLAIHATVVMLPLAAISAVAIAVFPAWRPRYGSAAVILTTIALLTVPVAIWSGQWLRDRLRYPAAFEHAELGEQTLWWSLPLWVLTVALVGLDRRAGMRRPVLVVLVVLAVLVVVAAAASVIHVLQVGHGGAESVWQGRLP